MKLTLLFFLIITSFEIVAQHSLDGMYEGVEPKYLTLENKKTVRWRDTENRKRYWYSIIYIKIKGDSVFLDDMPVTIYKKDTAFSSSDGGFFYYTGLVQISDSLISLNFKELYCDYCGFPQKGIQVGGG